MIGQATADNGGNASVTLSGSAAFTSGTSYQCTAAYTASAGTAAPSITTKTATGFAIKTDKAATVQFICVGN